MFVVDPAWIAAAAAIFGGAGVKFVEHWINKNRVSVDDASRLRDELRLEISDQRNEIKELEVEVNKWRDEYYDLRDRYIELQTDMRISLQILKREIAQGQENK